MFTWPRLTIISPCALLAGAALLINGCDDRSPTLPTPTGTCPAFVDGPATFSAAGVQRSVQLYLDPGAAAAKDGPLVLFFNHTSAPSAVGHFGAGNIQRIKDAGGIVAEMMLEFDQIRDLQTDLVADEIVACARQRVGIDAKRVHAAGYNWATPAPARFAASRPYVASVAVHRGGFAPVGPSANQRFATLVTYHYYTSPEADSGFFRAATNYYDSLVANGQYALMCATTGPEAATTMAAATRFFFDHPYGTQPSPYAAVVPAQPFERLPLPADVSGLPPELSEETAGYICPFWDYPWRRPTPPAP